jgi:hypothetical protein
MRIPRVRGLLLVSSFLILPPGPSQGPETFGSAAPAYQLRIDLRRPSQGLILEGTVRLPALPQPRETLEMTLRSDMQPADVRVLRPRTGAGTVRLERVDSAAAPTLRTTWRLHPPGPIAAGEPVELVFRASGGSRTTLNFHVGAQVAFAGGGTTPWYPQFGGPHGAGRIEFRLPPGWRVQASGRPAPSPGGHPSFVVDSAAPSDLGFVAGPFQEYNRKLENRRVRVLLLQRQPYAGELASVAARTIRVLEREFGPYPFSDFAIVEVPTGPASASGFIGAAYAGYMLVRSDFLATTKADVAHFGHEIGHQWWGVSVQRAGDAGDYMLDEALAQYGALRAVEEISGPDAAERFRAGTEGLGGEEDGLRLIAAGFGYPLGRLPHEPAAYALSDSKGYLVYDLLARTMGPDRFRAALTETARDYRSKELSWDGFLGRLQRHAGRELGWFFAQWFGRRDAPVVDWRWRRAAGDAVQVKVVQRRPPYRLTLPVVLEYADGARRSDSVTISTDSTTATFSADQTVTRVLLDPQHLVFHATGEEWDRARALASYTRGELLWNHGDAEAAESVFLAGLDSVPLPDSVGVEFLLRLHLGWIADEAGRADEAMGEYRKASELAVRSPAMLARLYWNISRLSRQRREPEMARWAARQVLAAEAGLEGRPVFTERARKALEEIR